MKLKKTLSNPWTIAIVAPVITLILLKAVDLLTGTTILQWSLTLLGNIFSSIYKFLTAKYEWRLYQLVLLFISVPALGIFILWIISKFQEAKEELKPEWFNYTQDNFNNVIYKWEWIKGYDGKYQIAQISPHCSNCECHLIHDKCPNCNSRYYNNIKENYEVEALILHRVNIMNKK